MKDLLISVLEQSGYPVFQQGSLGKDEKYPDSFFTFWNNETYGDDFYDNEENFTVWDFDLNFYSTNPVLVDEMLIKASKKLKESGFIVRGKGHDVASDEITHTGRGIKILKIEI
ncbi:MAG: hypothetical protein K2I00_02130 [Ruminococcus sp.]|nr:hypothetical protein [Ruminococcus sp.]